MILKEDTLLINGLTIFIVIVEHLGEVLHIGVLNPLNRLESAFSFLFQGLFYPVHMRRMDGFLNMQC